MSTKKISQWSNIEIEDLIKKTDPTAVVRFEKVLNILRKEIEKRSAVNFLDYGCCKQELQMYLKSKLNKNEISKVNFYSFEPDENIAKMNDKENFFTNSENIPNDFFDFIVSTEVIEHVYNVPDYINTIKKKLKYNALLFITTPNSSKILALVRLLIGRFDSWYHNPHDVHIRFFTKGTLMNLFKDDFKVINISVENFFKYKVSSIWCLFKKK